MLVEYACSTDVAVNFYATSLLIMHRPDAKVGTHGLKLRGCVIQTPIEPNVTSLEAELFSYTEIVKQYAEKVY